MKLICFPHYTCGGLLCDLLNDTFSTVNQKSKGINSFEHNFGKIGDSDSVFDNFNLAAFYSSLEKANLGPNTYIGTHCWPGGVDIDRFDTVICITTSTYKSRIYRWARSFYHYYLPSEPWQLTGMDLVDKQRETAKNYLKPFSPVKNAINIEFSEIVEHAPSFQQLVDGHNISASIDRWKQLNQFLYEDDFWNSPPVQVYYQAELEVLLDQRYVYTT